MKNHINKLALLAASLFFMVMSCKQPKSTESGEGDNFDQNHPMESEGVNAPETDTTAPVPTHTDPTHN